MPDKTPVLNALDIFALQASVEQEAAVDAAVAAEAQRWQGALSEAEATSQGLRDQVIALGAEKRALEHRLDILLNPVKVLLRMNLDGIPDGPVTPALWQQIFGAPAQSTNQYMWKNLKVMTDATGRFIRVTLPAGTYGVNNGIAAIAPLSEPAVETTCTYSVRISADAFNPAGSKGGKLPGPMGSAPGYPVGLGAAGLADPDNAAWSARLMETKPWASKPVMLVNYMYHHPGQKDATGDHVDWNMNPAYGVKTLLTNRNRLNSVDEAGVAGTDGLIQTYLNGTPALDVSGYPHRVRADVLQRVVGFSVFRGGNDSSFAMPNAGTVDIYDDFTVTAPNE